MFPPLADAILNAGLPLNKQAPKLLDRVRWHLRRKHYTLRTEGLCLQWIVATRHALLSNFLSTVRSPEVTPHVQIGVQILAPRFKVHI